MNRQPNHSTKPNQHDSTARSERAVLASILEKPILIHEADLSSDEFLLGNHRKIWQAMKMLAADGRVVDIVSVTNIAAGVNVDYISGLLDDGVVPENFLDYVKDIRRACRLRQFARLAEGLDSTVSDVDRLTLLSQMRQLIESNEGQSNWRRIFHSVEEFENAPPLSFAIDDFLPLDGITALCGLSQHGKTLIALAATQAILTGSPLFGIFEAPRRHRVVYLCPESAIGPFKKRIRLFHLEDYIKNDALLVRTLSAREQVTGLLDPRILQAAKDSMSSLTRLFVSRAATRTLQRTHENSRTHFSVCYRVVRGLSLAFITPQRV